MRRRVVGLDEASGDGHHADRLDEHDVDPDSCGVS
jgi:hypothetical protein